MSARKVAFREAAFAHVGSGPEIVSATLQVACRWWDVRAYLRLAALAHPPADLPFVEGLYELPRGSSASWKVGNLGASGPAWWRDETPLPRQAGWTVRLFGPRDLVLLWLLFWCRDAPDSLFGCWDLACVTIGGTEGGV